MKRKPFPQQVDPAMLAKTFPNILSHWLATEFPHLGGPKVRALFVDEVVRLIETHYLPRERLRPGQTVWYAVDQTDFPREGHSMAQTRLVPVILTLVAREDSERLLKGEALRAVRRDVVVRLHREADEQGGVLAATDTGLLLNQSYTTINGIIRDYEQEHQCIVPRRGTVHDLGRAVTHKKLSATKAFQEAKQAPDVAWEASHSLASTERYLVDLMRVSMSLKRRAMTPRETACATGLSLPLVQEYADLIAELGLNDDQLPGIIAKLEHMAQTRTAEPATLVAPEDDRSSQAPDSV